MKIFKQIQKKFKLEDQRFWNCVILTLLIYMHIIYSVLITSYNAYRLKDNQEFIALE